jgi:hypothetical protein
MTSLHRRIASLVLPAAATALFAAPGCIIDDSSLSEDDLFFCVSDDDCTTARHVCNLTTNSCELFVVQPEVCDDQDDDGYGVGEDRTECRFPEEDTDDTDADIFPGAADLCDGKDNDSDGTADEPLECSTIADCPTQNLPESSFFRCDNGLCILKPSNTATAGCDVVLNCTNAAYDQVPEMCK